MYSVTIRDHFMIAHSFHGEVFGPARQLHGATYVVDATFKSRHLDDHNLVVDIGLASRVLGEILESWNYRNLDELEAFRGQNTTTEFMARVVFDELAGASRDGRLGEGGRKIQSIRVRLGESHRAWASYESETGESESGT